MSLSAGRVGVRADQVDSFGRVISPSFLNEIMEDLPEWTDLPVRVNGTEQLIPSNPSVPVTSPILTDIDYPDIRRNDQYFIYRESPTTVDGLAKIRSIKGNTLVWNQLVPNVSESGDWNGLTVTNNGDGSLTIDGTYTGETTGNLPITSGDLTLLASHKYLINLHSTALPTYNIRISTSVTFVTLNSNGWRVGSPTSDRTGRLIYRIPSGTVFSNTKITPQIFDITTLDIDTLSDNEVYQWFAKYFPLPYYAYESGKLLSFNGTGIKTTNENGTEENTTNLPVATYFPTGMKSARSVYDELIPTKAVTRVGAVDLGTLRWVKDGVTGRFYHSGLLSNMKGGINGICAIYAVNNTPVGNPGSSDNAIFPHIQTNKIYILDKTRYDSMTATEFQSSLSGVYFYYELATPVELPTLSFE